MSQKSIKKNYVYNVIYQILIIIIPVVVTPYISRVLDPEGVGQYSFSLALITYFTIFASLGFGTYAQREIAKHQDDKEQQSIVFWEIFFCRLISVFLSLAVNLVLAFCGVYGKYTQLMFLFCINIIAIAFDIGFFFAGNEEFGKLVFINLILRVLGTIGIFVFVKKPQDVWIYALLNSLLSIIANLSIWLFIRKKVVKIKFNKLRPLRHLRGALRLFIPTLAVSIYTVLDKTLIGVITHSDAENGFYEQAEKIVKMSMTVITCLGTVMIPRNSYELGRGNIEQVRINNYNALHFVWLLGMPLMFGNIFVARNLVPWFLGENFMSSISLIQILAPLVLIIGISNVIGLQYLLPCHKDRQFTFAITAGAVINLIMNIPLIYYFGSFGASLSTIIAELIVTTIMLIMVAKHLNFGKIILLSCKPLLASLIMCVAIYPLSYFLTPSILHTLIIVVVGVIVYGLAILILRDSLVMSILHVWKFKLRTMKTAKTESVEKTVSVGKSENTDADVIDQLD